MRHPGSKDDAAGEAFWRFSLALYARPGVADALIATQDRTARDVNLILFALWLGASRGCRRAGRRRGVDRPDRRRRGRAAAPAATAAQTRCRPRSCGAAP